MALIVLAFLGLCLITAGAAVISYPVGMIVAGVLCVVVAYLLSEERGR